MQSQMKGEKRKIVLNDCEEVIGSVISIDEDGFIQIDNYIVYLPEKLLKELINVNELIGKTIHILRIGDCYRFLLKQKEAEK